jgi:hypothetical protein
MSIDQVLKRKRVEHTRFATWLTDTSYNNFTSIFGILSLGESPYSEFGLLVKEIGLLTVVQLVQIRSSATENNTGYNMIVTTPYSNLSR